MNRSVLTIALFLLSACAVDGPLTGELGRVELSYADGNDRCADRCDPGLPLASGSMALLRIENAAVLPELTMRATDTAVLDVRSTFSTSLWVVRGGTPGSAYIELLEGDEVVDRFAMETRPVASLTLMDGDVSTPLTLQPRAVRLGLYDVDGAALRGFDVVDGWSATDGLVVTPVDLGVRLDPPSPSNTWLPGVSNDEVWGLGGDLRGGVGTITWTTGEASLTIEVTLAAPDVTAIRLGARSDTNASIVTATIALANAGPGIEACCDWSFSPTDASVYLSNPRCTEVRVASTDPSVDQTATVACAARGVEQQIAVTILAGP